MVASSGPGMTTSPQEPASQCRQPAPRHAATVDPSEDRPPTVIAGLVLAVRQASAQGLPQAQIARLIGRSQPEVSRLLRFHGRSSLAMQLRRHVREVRRRIGQAGGSHVPEGVPPLVLRVGTCTLGARRHSDAGNAPDPLAAASSRWVNAARSWRTRGAHRRPRMRAGRVRSSGRGGGGNAYPVGDPGTGLGAVPSGPVLAFPRRDYASYLRVGLADVVDMSGGTSLTGSRCSAR